jgi:hypothetical protein
MTNCHRDHPDLMTRYEERGVTVNGETMTEARQQQGHKRLPEFHVVFVYPKDLLTNIGLFTADIDITAAQEF